MSQEMGKSIAEARADRSRSARAAASSTPTKRHLLADEVARTDAKKSWWPTSPWAGARHHALELPLLAGDPRRGAGAHRRQRMLLKHADNVPGCALALEAAFRDAGFRQACSRP